MNGKASSQVVEEAINEAYLKARMQEIQLQSHQYKLMNTKKFKIHPPKNIAFSQSNNFLKIIDGFTPEATKNIIALSSQQIRVYSVTEDKINFLSCSQLPKEIAEFIYANFSSPKARINFNSKSGVILIFKDVNTFVYTIKLCRATGKLLNVKKSDFSYFKQKGYDLKVSGLPPPKNSIKDSLQILSSSDMQKIYNFLSIFRERGCVFKRLLDLTKIVRDKILEESELFSAQKETYLNQNPQSNLSFHDKLTDDFFQMQKLSIEVLESKSPENVYFCIQSRNIVFLCLIRLRSRKILWVKSFNLFDLLSMNNRIDELARVQEEDQDPDHRGIKCGIDKILVDHLSDSLIVSISVGKTELLVKLNSFLRSRGELRMNQVTKAYRGSKDLSSLTGPILDDGYLLCSDSEPGDPDMGITLALLNMKSLLKVELKGFESSQARFSMRFSWPKIAKLSQSRILILSSLSAYIYDYSQGRMITEYRHTLFCNEDKPYRSFIQRSMFRGEMVKCPRPSPFQQFVKQGQLIANRFSDFLDLVLITKIGLSDRAVQKINSIYFSDLFTGIKYEDRNYDQLEIFQQDNGDNLIITSQMFQEGKKVKIKLKVCGKTIKILEAKRLDKLSTLLSRQPSGIRYHFVSGFFIFAIKPIATNLERDGGSERVDSTTEDYSFLTLSNADFEILHQSTQAKLGFKTPIGMISSGRIISRGETGREIFLHVLDKDLCKLVLLKKVSLGSWSISSSLKWEVSPYSFCALAPIDRTSSERSNRSPYLGACAALNFDRDLNLVSYALVKGLSKGEYVASLPDNKLIVYPLNPGPRHFCFYSLDLNTHRFMLVHESSRRILSRNSQESRDRGFYSIELIGDSIDMVLLG